MFLNLHQVIYLLKLTSNFLIFSNFLWFVFFLYFPGNFLNFIFQPFYWDFSCFMMFYHVFNFLGLFYVGWMFLFLWYPVLVSWMLWLPLCLRVVLMIRFKFFPPYVVSFPTVLFLFLFWGEGREPSFILEASSNISYPQLSARFKRK